MKGKMIFKTCFKVLKKNAPTIMMVTGIGGMLTAVIMAVDAKDKADHLIDEAYMDKNETVNRKDSDLTFWEEVKAAFPAYWPAGVVFLTSAGLIVGANSMNLKRNAALLAAAELSEATLRDWQKRTLEIVDKDTGDRIKSEVYKDQGERAKRKNDSTIMDTRHGNVLCQDAITGRRFYSDRQHIGDAVNYLNALLLEEGIACYNDFCDYLNIDHCDIGYVIGWRYSDKHDLIRWTDHYIKDEEGNPVLVVELDTKPDYDFQKSAFYGV